nr:tocopherol cyclase family protein [uncultured Oscillibacter sp.]
MGFFRSTNRTGPYFEGWYFKLQNPQGQALALIPALHIDEEGRRAASLQVISKDQAWWLEYPEAQLHVSRRPFQVQAGQSRFGSQGIELHIQRDGLSLRGILRHGPFTALRSDIMGPFRFFGGMQCAHGVISMGHSLSGSLELNGRRLDFSDGIGYIETDRGRSFPSKYLWTQCVWGGPELRSLMLAIAAIPLPAGGFTGCICSVFHDGREYRLATYRGAKIEAWSSSGAVIRQGKYRLEAQLLSERRQALRAPVEGRMERTIHESLCGEVRYRFWHGKDLLFQRTDPSASFEYSFAE